MPWLGVGEAGIETAKEILAEIFRIRVSDMEEMIQNRFEAHYEETPTRKSGLWPRGSADLICHEKS